MGRQDPLRELLLAPLRMHFLAADQAYRDYLANGKTFRFACLLRQANDAARELLVTHGHLLAEAMRPHAAALVNHYETWTGLWDELAAAAAPAMDDRFVFENSVRFPKEAQRALMDLYEVG